MDHIFKLTPEEKALNQKYWQKDASAIGTAPEGAGAQGGAPGGMEGGAQIPAQGGAQAPAQGGAQAPAQGGAQAPPPAQGGAQGGAEFEF